MSEKLHHELNLVFDHNLNRINEWLDTPIPRLNGECPRSWLEADFKQEELFQVLQEMKSGDFT
ncbi:hypothetical protein [Rheinheimera sp.]|uniref:hypothetical protein n=1 Tax=Rheinheimera sp. TaxID=1869214 RepID=UPI003D29B1F9